MKAEFNDFLFAPLGEDRNGLPLTVISLLARMNLDPWQEAKDLSELSPEAANKRLTFCLGALTEPALVLRLLALLPSRAAATAEAPVADTVTTAPGHPGLSLRTLFIIAAAIVLVGSQLLSRHRLDPTPAGGADAPSAAAPGESRPPPPSGR